MHQQICICDDCGSRNINMRFTPIIDKDIPVPDEENKFGSGKHNYKWYCIKIGIVKCNYLKTNEQRNYRDNK